MLGTVNPFSSHCLFCSMPHFCNAADQPSGWSACGLTMLFTSYRHCSCISPQIILAVWYKILIFSKLLSIKFFKMKKNYYFYITFPELGHRYFLNLSLTFNKHTKANLGINHACHKAFEYFGTFTSPNPRGSLLFLYRIVD
jgi:hypothetical protein